MHSYITIRPTKDTTNVFMVSGKNPRKNFSCGQFQHFYQNKIENSQKKSENVFINEGYVYNIEMDMS